MDEGDAVIPCLIERVTDRTAIRDPRQVPRYPDTQTTIGDIAYFLIVDITKLDFVELLPVDVQRRSRTEGVYAYFEFVKESSNRVKVRDKLNNWHSQRLKQSNKPDR